MRLIDADRLKQEIATIMPSRIDVNLIVDVQPDAVVRCKDCKYGEPWGVLIGCGTTKGFGITHKPDWFCADGERKDNG